MAAAKGSFAVQDVNKNRLVVNFGRIFFFLFSFTFRGSCAGDRSVYGPAQPGLACAIKTQETLRAVVAIPTAAGMSKDGISEHWALCGVLPILLRLCYMYACGCPSP